MKLHQLACAVMSLSLLSLGTSVGAVSIIEDAPIIEDTFTGYLDNALISESPAGPGIGLTGDWTLVPDSNFYVNKTQLDDDAGTGKAVYDRPSGDNGTREATRMTSAEQVLFETDGGGTPAFSFGILDGEYVVGNGGIGSVSRLAGCPRITMTGFRNQTDLHTRRWFIDLQRVRNPYVEVRRHCAAPERLSQLPSAPSRFR